ncbi:unnamed protein product [Arabis nemorensis]|uniref:Uncharacterized protein n=1 Tax=Arabis nemorensis TaxID=586526 RepID=A0A565BH60_9BRAS|nr:unnamed protein product [Arabis nemorensis]
MSATFVSYISFSDHVKSEFNVGASMTPTFTYWVRCTMPLIDTVKNPPVAFTTYEGFSNYKVMRAVDKGVTLFVEFEDVQNREQEYSVNIGCQKELVYSLDDVFPANCTPARGDREEEEVSDDDPVLDEEFEDFEESIRHESGGEEDEEYDMDHWTELINREYEAGEPEDEEDGRTSAVESSEET